jgi:outer membrane lipoprotein-sorting protein
MIQPPRLLLVLLIVLFSGAALAQAPSTTPATAPNDQALWDELVALDALSSKVESLEGRFEQQKQTPLLRRPMVSSGRIQARGDTALWTTTRPRPTVMLVNPRELQLYYPDDRVLEIYPIMGDLGAMAASPLPRLATLKRFFQFARDEVAELDPTADPQQRLAVRLTPIDPELARHIQQVRVLLDRRSGLVLVAQTLDVDGDRTTIRFDELRTGQDVGDLRIDPSPGTKISRPLEAAPPESR